MGMELITPVRLPDAPFHFSYADRIQLFGSCFVEHIGEQLAENKFEADLNPFGILFNPESVALALERLADPRPFVAEELVAHDGLYHSLLHHGRFSAADRERCLARLNERLAASSARLRQATRLIITWGTAFIYRLRTDGRVVANCHKLPEQAFVRERLTPEQIEARWDALLQRLWQLNPALKILFTVSPVRHWKDGAQGNQLSKATLLLAVDGLVRRDPARLAYFPSYEILMDELRDYRFYAEDLLHPSPLAIRYIWERFRDHLLTEESRRTLAAWQEIQRALAHRPLHPESEGYRQFLLQTLLKLKRLNGKMPSFASAEEAELERRLHLPPN